MVAATTIACHSCLRPFGDIYHGVAHQFVHLYVVVSNVTKDSSLLTTF
jgi:uncharacterized protein YlbG (UPF0298 family)